MLCPACKTVELAMAERQGIEIDYCPTCRGVWLDRGELDKIIDRTMQHERGNTAAAAPERGDAPARDWRPTAQRSDHRHDHGHDDHEDGHHDNRRSFWRDLFD